MGKSIFSKIFSISDYGKTHRVMHILGIKIKFPKSEYFQKQKSNPYEFYKKNNVDITQIPSATGQVRNIQLANLELLKELDYVCRQNNLKYWIDFGTLLGAIRHKGFIPWDDDIDTGMMREDYDKIIDSFKKSSRNPDIFAEYTYLGKAQTIIKIKHKKCPHIFVDIFPREYSNAIETNENKMRKTQKLITLRQKINKMRNLDNTEKVLKKVKELTSELIPNVYTDNSDIQYALDYSYTEPVWVHSHDTIFPLKEITFENLKVMCINKPEKYLSEIFGNYMNYPKKFGFGHSMYLNLTQSEKEVVEELAR